MNENEFSNLTLFEAAQLIVRNEIAPLELAEACFARIEKYDEVINSFITLTPEPALYQAERAGVDLKRVISSGITPVSPLFGVPIAYKDLYETAGVLTTAGSTFFKDYIPSTDSTVVNKLSAAGVISLGKLNLHEIALGVTNVNPHFGACRNPWAPDRVSGGSSGGSAAALAAGFIFGSMGTDTGGSIRIPASLCGIVGLKPTFGRISLNGVLPLSWNLDHAGPMARSVKDVALLLSASCGYDPLDPCSVNKPAGDYFKHIAGGVKGWRIAVADDDFFERTSKEISQGVHQAGQIFENLAAHVDLVPFPGARQAARYNGLVTVSDAAVIHKDRLEQDPQGFGADVLKRLNMGAAAETSQYIQARRHQVELRRQFERFFEEFDLLLTPTTPVAAPLIEGPDAVEQAHLLTRYTAPFNLTGLPAISIPCGFTQSGLPFGLQIVSRPWGEASILQAAYAFEQETPWHKKMPAL